VLLLIISVLSGLQSSREPHLLENPSHGKLWWPGHGNWGGGRTEDQRSFISHVLSSVLLLCIANTVSLNLVTCFSSQVWLDWRTSAIPATWMQRSRRSLTGKNHRNRSCAVIVLFQSLPLSLFGFSSSPPLTQFFLDCGGLVKTDKKPALCKSYQKLITDLWHKNRYTRLVPFPILFSLFPQETSFH